MQFREVSVSDGIIDIGRFRAGSGMEPSSTFSVLGGTGDRARFALPLWRAVILAGGDRGGLLRLTSLETSGPEPSFVLDLAHDPARTGFPPLPEEIAAAQEAPTLGYLPEGGVAVFLGEEAGDRWFLLVVGGEVGVTLVSRAREDLLFLAGECAGLLFFRGLAGGEG
jgi:hypothetical protein